MIVSFLTPTYNRGYILGQLYASLCAQSLKDFEWIVIDDGSVDETEALILQWKRLNVIPIKYHKQENGGKHRALNVGVLMVESPYTCIVDSDDYLVKDAVALIEDWTQQIHNQQNFAGVSGVRKTPGGELIGMFPENEVFVDATDIQRRQYRLEGDKAEVYKTDLLRNYPFPEFTGENFLSECAVWNRIGMDGYYIRWFRDALIICQYREDGLTMTSDKEVNNYQGYTYVIKQQLEYEPFFRRLALIAQYDHLMKGNLEDGSDVCSKLQISRVEQTLARWGKSLYAWVKKWT